jgi:hypothetical protein
MQTASLRIVTDSLLWCVDGANPRSSGGRRSLINWESWVAGTGTVTGYNINGDVAENSRTSGTDPQGNTAIVWECVPDAVSGPDGGWNTTAFNIDITKLYRFSLHVMRTSASASGNIYFGLYTDGANDVLNLDDNATEDNPYWHYPAASTLTQNQWYMFVGHIYPWNTSRKVAHQDSGYYTVPSATRTKAGVNAGNIPYDCKFPLDATTALHRTYLYYCTDSSVRVRFLYPRVDLCDGTEPSIDELNHVDPDLSPYYWSMNGSIYNLIHKDENSLLHNFIHSTAVKYDSSDAGGCYSYDADGVNSHSNQNFINPSFTLQAWIKRASNANSYNMFMGRYLPYFCLRDVTGSAYLFFSASYVGIGQQSVAGNANWSDGVWYLATVTVEYDGSYSNVTLYMNDAYDNSDSFSGALNNGDYSGYYMTLGDGLYSGAWYRFDGKIAWVAQYDRALSATEVAQNFNATKRRFGY